MNADERRWTQIRNSLAFICVQRRFQMIVVFTGRALASLAVQFFAFQFQTKQEQIYVKRNEMAVWRYESGDVAGRQFDGD
jgi:hypothetical protein